MSTSKRMSNPSKVGVVASNDSVRVVLAPSAGFCIKSVTTDTGIYTASASSSSPVDSKKTNLLEPPSVPKTEQVPRGVKVFLNIAWDKHVPSPPPADEAVVRRAMAGEDLDDPTTNSMYYVPVVVSEPREATDKSGKPSLVFDCVFSTTLKPRCTKDREFKMYLIELALEHVEEKIHATLSRQIGTPNIASKGKLGTRTVLIPKTLSEPRDVASASTTPLVREISNSTSIALSPGSSLADIENKEAQVAPAPKKSSLRNSMSSSSEKGVNKARPLIEEIISTPLSNVHTSTSKRRVNDAPNSIISDDSLDTETLSALPPPRWTWILEDTRIRIDVEVSTMTHTLHSQSTFDVESRRIILHIPRANFLDINLDLPDAEIGRINASRMDDAAVPEEKTELDVDVLRVKGHNAGQALGLKRQRDFDVANARAEWRVGERRLALFV
ncbi:hypothetical protein EW145_g7638 [Phellinidium pouzarii]|uniref:PIH1 N-terminal domain-containing protein n=1 Tax=Phellinidium pouzarii TaxID=167371 RepID=A0A4S4KGG9_9AGAM|nr:hypothetical protein EW145_g7638 [Phellinidium pouzarii]